MDEERITIESIREIIKKELTGSYPGREIETMISILFENYLDLSPHEISLNRDRLLDKNSILQLKLAGSLLRERHPIQYITGTSEFYGLPIQVSPAVLIPRPETEELVRMILNDHPPRNPRIYDIGTGSGCIALALKKNLPQAEVIAGDVSEDALEIARNNADKNGLRIQFLKHDILAGDNLRGDFPFSLMQLDIIVSNPPYIPEFEKKIMDLNVLAHEPHEALFVPDSDPLKFYRHIGNFAIKTLVPGGKLYLEIHEKRGKEIKELLDSFGFLQIEIRTDINGKERMAICKKNDRENR